MKSEPRCGWSGGRRGGWKDGRARARTRRGGRRGHPTRGGLTRTHIRPPNARVCASSVLTIIPAAASVLTTIPATSITLPTVLFGASLTSSPNTHCLGGDAATKRPSLLVETEWPSRPLSALKRQAAYGFGIKLDFLFSSRPTHHSSHLASRLKQTHTTK